MNKRKFLLIFAALLCTAMTFAATAMTRAQLAEYAKSLKGLKKSALKTAIYNLCQPTTVLDYSAGSGHTWSGFYQTDRIVSTNECRNRYSSTKYYFPSNYTSSYAAISGMNIEHSFPKSWWGGSENNAYKDLFNLYPSESSANSSKSNYPMGKVTNATLLDDYEKVGTGDAGGSTIRLCEPNDTWKGDFCRSYFYMATIYQNLTWEGEGSSVTGGGLQSLENDTWPTLKVWAYTLYLKWADKGDGTNDPDRVDQIEVDRNNAVYSIQGNRNLFIDFPELAEYVWGDSIDVAFNPETSLTSTAQDTRFAVYQAGNYPSGVVTETASAPTLASSASFTTDSYDVTITNNESGATVYYTTDGNDPTTSSSSFTGGSKTISISETTTVKAMAVLSGKNNSTIASAKYTKEDSGDTPTGTKASSIMIVLHTKASNTSFKGFTFSNADGLTGTYSSSDENVAKVDASTGAITLVGPGSTTITYTVGGDDEYNEASMSYGIEVTE